MGRLAVSLLLLSCFIFTGVGCGQRLFYPVKGQVVFEDGSPVKGADGAQIIFEAKGLDGKAYSASGTLDTEGRFELTTKDPKDGAPLGKCKVMIARKMIDPERAAPRVIHEKYENFDTSGLELEVTKGDNNFTIKVEPYTKKKK